MEKRVLIDTWQKVVRDDFLKFGTFPRDSFDTIVGKLLIPDRAFEGFNVVQSGPAEVTVGSGHLFNNGAVYFNDTEGGTTIDLLSRLPAVTRRIVAITVWGQEINSKLEPRTFLTDAETRATVARATATEHWRWANIGPVSGVEGPDPQPPAVSADVVTVAYVTLSTTGIESIIRADENLTPTLREADNRLNEYDIWRKVIGTLVDTLRSDLLALAAKLFGLAPWEFVRAVTADVARIKDKIRLPSTYTAWAADHFLTTDYSDTAHPDWLASIEEGVRFPAAAGFDAQLGLLNPLDSLVTNTNNVILPAWDPAIRISNVGFDDECAIAQYNYQTVDMVQKMMARQVTRYGTPFTVCSNSQFWQTGTFDYANWTFNRGGEVFQVEGAVTLDVIGTAWGGFAHNVVRLQQVWQDTVMEPYWDRVVTNYSVNGAVIAETFPNSQDGWLCHINLFFSRVAATGDVTVLICQLTNESPDPSKIIARSTLPAGSLKTATAANPTGTTFRFQPTFLGKGRYGIIVMTAGNHYVWRLKNTNYIAGTFFYSTDGHWFQGDLTEDLAFEAYFCKFRSNLTKVQLNPVQLQNGIAAIDINADTIVPDGTSLWYEVQKDGVWAALTGEGQAASLFAGLPPLLPFRACFQGSDSTQPALGVSSNSRVTTWRPRSDFRHISAVRGPMSTINKITLDVRLESWRDAADYVAASNFSSNNHHHFRCFLLHGNNYATMRPADVATAEVAPDDPNAVIFHLTYYGMGNLTSYRFRMEGTTDNVLTTYHVAERLDVAFVYSGS
ncbi:hypothetical protein [Bradyrhizobium sp. Leo121]|uniref:hypothetical protein n=1 Tax=Bradyrhizobium sp. Leo121 TaxID=1571195 RepID=UPI001028AC7D|nr:hypothetical protein [Bradyrhizobium sp. Leo121]RZN24768.1 hypothetical protein CWO90_28415 [Bradyrhizobium sp. Leo121]